MRVAALVAVAAAAVVCGASRENKTLTVFLHVPTSGGRTLSDLNNHVVPTHATGSSFELDERSFEAIRRVCRWPSRDVWLQGHLSLRDVRRLGPPPRDRLVRFVVVVREPLQRARSWLLHEAPDWLWAEFGRLRPGDVGSRFLRREVQNRLAYQIGDAADVTLRDAHAGRVMERARSVLRDATVLYMHEISVWLATVSACTGRTARPVSSRFRVPRRLEPRHLRVLRELNTLDLELVAWLQRTKPTSDEWTCLVSRNLPETRDPRDRDSPST